MWSLDWFTAENIAQTGTPIRRVAWTDKWLIAFGVLWYFQHTDGTKTLVQTGEFGAAEFTARDYTDQPFNANPCAALPAYNVQPPTYGDWGQPIQTPPPVPGFPSA